MAVMPPLQPTPNPPLVDLYGSTNAVELDGLSDALPPVDVPPLVCDRQHALALSTYAEGPWRSGGLLRPWGAQCHIPCRWCASAC